MPGDEKNAQLVEINTWKVRTAAPSWIATFADLQSQAKRAAGASVPAAYDPAQDLGNALAGNNAEVGVILDAALS